MAEQEHERSWKPIHQLMFDYLKHLGYDDAVVEEFKKRCLDANYPYFKPFDDWIFIRTSFPSSSSGPVQIGKVTTIDPTKVYRLISGEARLVEEFGNVTLNETTGGTMDDRIFRPTSFPSSSSGTVQIGKVTSTDPTKVYRLVSGEARLVEEIQNVPLYEIDVTTSDPLAFPNETAETFSDPFSPYDPDETISDPIPLSPIPYELVDPEKVHMFGEILGVGLLPPPSDPSLKD
ncbi:uncharacterized protein LOC119983918 [Tripterygium wilfordii]|uniref:uncharacterized protein LOC119983918 n=1 Tax=Tripterygium wilfordii TaxID=458696 RepID=UPI0018F85358|nr:uncharacterized protein LOC119983918 [Tripterygium wilfordii]